MKKKLTAVLCALLITVGSIPVASAQDTKIENITGNAKITSDIPVSDPNKSVAQLCDGDTGTPLLSDGTQTIKFPYTITFDFGNYEALISELKVYTLMGKDMGITNISIDYEEKGTWKTATRSGIIFQWDSADSTNPELRTVHFDTKLKTSKLRLTVNAASLKKNAFRIDEIALYGAITGTVSGLKIKDVQPVYVNAPLGQELRMPDQVSVTMEDDSKTQCNVTWDSFDVSKEGILLVKGTLPFYEEKASAVVDLFDMERENEALKEHWAESFAAQLTGEGLLGSIPLSPDGRVTMIDTAVILQRINRYPLNNSEINIEGLDKNDGRYLICAAAVGNKVFDGDFTASKELTRLEALLLVMKNIDISQKEILTTETPGFSDLSALDAQQKAAVEKAFQLGIISDADRFRPEDAILMPEFLVMVKKALQKPGETDSAVLIKNFSDNQKALVNPYMGLFSYYLDNGTTSYDVHYSNDDYFTDIEGLSNIYIRVPWSVVEPEKDYYDFSIVDGLIQKFEKVGKQVSLRFTTSETGYVYATPKWVFDDGAKAYWWDNGNLSMPYYNDPIFLKHLDNFLGELAKRYDGNPNIAYIDIGTIGLWGEGHTGNSQYPLTQQEVLSQMELYQKHFKKTAVVILDDLGFGFNNRFTEQIKGDIVKMGFGLRNDGFAGIDGNMRFIRDEDIALADGIWQQAPIIMEPEHYSEMIRVDNWGDGMGLVEWIDKVHGTYLGLHGYVKQFYYENPQFAHAANMRLGYRILPEQVKLQTEVRAHEKLSMKVEWKNVAAAPCYNGAYPALTLKDENGNIVSVMVDSNFNIKDLPVASPGAAKAVTQEALFRMHDVLPGGTYKAYLSLGSLDGTPEIKMPIDAQNDGDDRYYLGDIKVKGDYSVKASSIDEKGNIMLHFDFHGNPEFEYKAFWQNIALRESGKDQVYMPGDMYQSVPFTEAMINAVNEGKTIDVPVKLEIQQNYKEKPLADPGTLKGKSFDVYYVLDTLSLGTAPGMLLSDSGRDVLLGTAVIDDNLNIVFTPNQE